jgi:hypothetical protein
MATPSTWTALVAAPDLPSAVFEHFRPALATSAANAALLRKISAQVRSAKLDTSDADEQYHTLILDFGSDVLRCSPPGGPNDVDAEDGDDEAVELMKPPPTYARILELHGRLQLVNAQVDLFYENYVEEEGWLDGIGLEGRGVFCPLRVYADIYIYHPDETLEPGEPALYFLDHETAEDGGERADGDIATVFLGHVAKALKV